MIPQGTLVLIAGDGYALAMLLALLLLIVATRRNRRPLRGL
jgi:hypothetical protein